MYRREGQADADRCSRFEPGQEDAARAFLEQPLRNRRYSVIEKRLVAYFLFIVPSVAVLAVSAALLGSDIPIWLSLTLYSIATLPPIVWGSLVARAHGLFFTADPERQIVRCNKTEHHFSALGLPRVVTTVSRSYNGVKSGGLLVTDHSLQAGKHKFFTEGLMGLRTIERVADRLNSMLGEYHEREEVRLWLERREAAIGQRAVQVPGDGDVGEGAEKRP